MNSIVVSNRLWESQISSKGFDSFLEDIENGKLDTLLFNLNHERAFEEGIVIVRDKKGNDKPAFAFSCRPFEYLPPYSNNTVMRTDGITLQMLWKDGQVHNCTIATYIDELVNGKSPTVGDNPFVAVPIKNEGNTSKLYRSIAVYPYREEVCNKETENLFCETSLQCLMLFSYIQKVAMRMKEKVEKARAVAEEMTISDNNKNNKENGNKKDKDKQFKPKYIVNLCKDVSYSYEPSNNNVHKEFIRHCECWAVRGHYRRCQSGKIVYVKPHLKGKNRNTGLPTDKTYNLDY